MYCVCIRKYGRTAYTTRLLTLDTCYYIMTITKRDQVDRPAWPSFVISEPERVVRKKETGICCRALGGALSTETKCVSIHRSIVKAQSQDYEYAAIYCSPASQPASPLSASSSPNRLLVIPRCPEDSLHLF